MSDDAPQKPRRAGETHSVHEPPAPMFCPRCGHSDGIVWVHGHGQCVVCGSVIEDCCLGAPAHVPPRQDRR